MQAVPIVFLLCGLLASCGRRSAPQPAAIALAEPGRKLFDNYCSACHRYDGQAMGQAPPLDSAVYAGGPESRLVRIILGGVSGPMEVDGRVYDNIMPGFAAILSDQQVAGLATFVRRAFARIEEPVTPETVARLRSPRRTTYWTVEELLALP
jgi:mono/diheme cytochrome c family protein